ncbi:metalloendopeptidase [Coemansia sp. RSA 552]|nr:metalloendopeptidase [Coemansia sp. RSA 552]
MTTTRTNAPDSLLNFGCSAAEMEELSKDMVAEEKRILDRVAQESTPTFSSVIEPLGEMENRHAAGFQVNEFLRYVSPDAEVRAAGSASEELKGKFKIERLMRADVHRAVRAVYENSQEMAALGAEDRRLVEKMEMEYRRSGLGLSEESQATLGGLKRRLVELELEYTKNANAGEAHVLFTRAELAGMPESFFADRPTQVAGGVTKYVVTTQYPDYFPLVKCARSEATRKAMVVAFKSRCPENVPLLQEAVQIRAEKARLLGYGSHAEYALEDLMAKTPQAVLAMEADLRGRLAVVAQAELDELEALKQADMAEANEECTGFYAWDLEYYKAMVKERKHGVQEEQVKQYFSMTSVVRDMLDIYQKMLGLRIVKVDNPEVWHPDVELFEVWEAEDDSVFVGHFYLDLYPRESKYSHAAVCPLRPGYEHADGTREYPVAAMMANFPKPTSTTPALMSHEDVKVMMHELGHVFHEICSRTKWSRFHGTCVEGDFVEAPSQMLENWAWEESVLGGFAVHHKTGEAIPKELVKSMVAAKNEGAGMFHLRQVFLGTYDLEIHNNQGDTPPVNDTFNAMSKEVGLIDDGDTETCFVATFQHLMGGYDSKYYGYLWSQVFSADMYAARFQKEGVDNSQTGLDYRREILQPGGTRDSMDSLVRFLGRQPNNEAFLKSIGLE